MTQALALHKCGGEVCDDLFQRGIFELPCRLARGHPLALPLMRFGPGAVHIVDFYRVNQGEDCQIPALVLLGVGVHPKTDVIWFSGEARFFPCLGRCRLCRCLIVHRPAFGDDPAFGCAACHETDLELRFSFSVAQCCKLRPRGRFLHLPQFQGELSAAAIGQRGLNHDDGVSVN